MTKRKMKEESFKKWLAMKSNRLATFQLKGKRSFWLKKSDLEEMDVEK